jgi:hypothetical protein
MNKNLFTVGLTDPTRALVPGLLNGARTDFDLTGEVGAGEQWNLLRVFSDRESFIHQSFHNRPRQCQNPALIFPPQLLYLEDPLLSPPCLPAGPHWWCLLFVLIRHGEEGAAIF